MDSTSGGLWSNLSASPESIVRPSPASCPTVSPLFQGCCCRAAEGTAQQISVSSACLPGICAQAWEADHFLTCFHPSWGLSLTHHLTLCTYYPDVQFPQLSVSCYQHPLKHLVESHPFHTGKIIGKGAFTLLCQMGPTHYLWSRFLREGPLLLKPKRCLLGFYKQKDQALLLGTSLSGKTQRSCCLQLPQEATRATSFLAR